MYTTIKYGVLSLTEGRAEMQEQNYLRQRYWNTLVEIEKNFWEQRDALILAAAPNLVPLQEAYDQRREELAQLRQEARDHRKAARTRKIPADLEAQIGTARTEAAEALTWYKTERAKVFEDDDVLARLKTLDASRTARVREARGACELYWGNYMDVEAFYRSSRARNGRLLKFHRPTQERGTASVFMTEGLATDRVFGPGPDDSRLRLEPVDPLAWADAPRSVRRHHWQTQVQLRLGTGPGRAPIYARANIVAHRPLPQGLVRHAALTWETLAGRRRYSLIIVVDTPDYPVVQEGLEQRPRLGVDIGWRHFGDRLRVAMLAWEGDRVEEISIPQQMVDGWRKMDDLQSIADTHFNTIKLRLAAALDRLAEGAPLPVWLAEARSTLALWRSRRRLLALLEVWQDQRVAGDDLIMQELDVWRKREKVLWQWEINGRDKLAKHRLDQYRNIAYRVATSAKSVTLEEFNLSQVTTDPETETAANYYRSIASCSTFRVVLEATCARMGVVVTRVEAAWTTQTCASCANVVRFAAKTEVRAHCPQCNAEWDQDENAARNLLAVV